VSAYQPSFPPFRAVARRGPNSEIIVQVMLWFEAPLGGPAEMPAGTGIPLLEGDLLAGGNVVTAERIVVTPPTMVALDGHRRDGAIKDLLPWARRALPLEFPLSPAGEEDEGISVALAGRLGGAVLRVGLLSSRYDGRDAPRPDFGQWELWSERAQEWRRAETVQGGGEAARPLEVSAGVSLRPALGAGDLFLPHDPARSRPRRPPRWWFRWAAARGDGAGGRVVRAVSAEIVGVRASARVLPPRGTVATGSRARPRASSRVGNAAPPDTGAGLADSLRPPASAVVSGRRLPFRLR
jgi:hypothetical protein